MNKEELDYAEGFDFGKDYWKMSQWNKTHINNFETPKSWSDAKANGFWDGVIDYCKEILK